MIDEYFKTAPIHCEGECDLTTDAANNLYTVGSDDLIYTKDLLTKVDVRMDLAVEGGSYTTIAAHPKEKGLLAIGGLNNEAGIMKFNDHTKPTLVFKALGAIRLLTFSRSGRYLAIATADPAAVLYNYEKKKIVKCKPGHSGSICSVFFSPDERYVCSTGTDGTLRVFRIEADQECTIAATYEVTSASAMNGIQNLMGCFNMKSTMIAMPGKPALQQVNIEPAKMYLTLNSSIKHSSDITICHWQNSEVLVTASISKEMSLWKYHTGEKIVSVQNLLPTRIITVQDRFYCIDRSGTLYEFYKVSLIKSELDELQALEREDQSEKASEKLEVEEVEDRSVAEPEEESYVEVKKPTKSKADKIVVCMPQAPISRSTSFFTNNRFLHISEFGFMIERLQGESQSIEMESFSVASAEPKKKNLFINRELKHFALCEGVVVYAGDSVFGMIGEDSWEVNINQVVAVAAGSTWVAAATEDSLMVFDLGGNQLRNVSLDKKVIALAGYENLLAYVYHDTVPMWGCQSLRMQIIAVDRTCSTQFVSETIVPIKLLSVLKTFGFSYEGLPYTEDSKGTVRVFSLQLGQWTTVYDPDASEGSHRTWLVGIRNYELIMYKLDKDDLEPTVFPRSPFVVLPMEVQTANRSLIYENKGGKKTYGQSLWKLHQLEHDRFRHEMWHKYTVSRDGSNPMAQLSAKIPSLEDIKIAEAATEKDFMYLIKNMLASNEAQKACVTVKTFVRTSKAAAKLVQIFEEAGMRELSIKIETHFEEKEREMEYQAIQLQRLEELQKQIHNSIASKPANPMQRGATPASQLSSSHPKTQTSIYSKPASRAELSRVEEEKHEAATINPFEKSSNNFSDKIKREFDSRIEKNTLAAAKSTKPERRKPEG